MVDFLYNPDFWFGVIVGAGLTAVLCVCSLALLGFLSERADELEALQRDTDAIRFGGDLPATAPPAANDATLNLRDAYSRPSSARRVLRSAPQ